MIDEETKEELRAFAQYKAYEILEGWWNEYGTWHADIIGGEITEEEYEWIQNNIRSFKIIAMSDE